MILGPQPRAALRVPWVALISSPTGFQFGPLRSLRGNWRSGLLPRRQPRPNSEQGGPAASRGPLVLAIKPLIWKSPHPKQS
jgi:hypothetical protein